MAKKTIQIQISKPCQEDFSKMTPVEKGKFCGSCEKVVTDFSRMSDQEIANFYLKNKGKICGRFHPSQLNRKISLDKPVVNSFFGKAAGVLLSGALSAGLANAASSELRVDPPIVEILDQVSSVQESKDEPSYFSNEFEVEILITEFLFKKPIKQVKISLEENSIFTDVKGKAKIKILGKFFKEGDVTINISHPDYFPEKIMIKKDELKVDTSILIELSLIDHYTLLGFTAITYEDNSWTDRVKKFFFEKEEELQNDIINNNLKVFGLEPPPDLNDDISKSDEPNSDVPLVPTLNVIINNIYPNPFIDKINLEITSAMEGEVQIRLFDISGRVVFQTKQNVVEGKQNIQLSPDISSAESNYFILQIQDENGNIQTRKIVRNLNGGFN